MRLRVGRGKVGLAFLKMLNLARGVLCAHEAAVQTAHFVTFGRCVLVLEFGLCGQEPCQHVSRKHRDLVTAYKSSSYVWVGMTAHGEGLLLPSLALRRAMQSCAMSCVFGCLLV
jgi:hypothetical protein